MTSTNDRTRPARLRGALLACVLLLPSAGCLKASAPGPADAPAQVAGTPGAGAASSPSPAPPATRAYAPVYASREKASAEDARGTLNGDYLWAADARTLEEAAARWQEFIRAHAPKEGPDASAEEELGDAYEANRVAAAKYELMRVQYLLGNVEQGDRLLRELDPLRLLR